MPVPQTMPQGVNPIMSLLQMLMRGGQGGMPLMNQVGTNPTANPLVATPNPTAGAPGATVGQTPPVVGGGGAPNAGNLMGLMSLLKMLVPQSGGGIQAPPTTGMPTAVAPKPPTQMPQLPTPPQAPTVAPGGVGGTGVSGANPIASLLQMLFGGKGGAGTAPTSPTSDTSTPITPIKAPAGSSDTGGWQQMMDFFKQQSTPPSTSTPNLGGAFSLGSLL